MESHWFLMLFVTVTVDCIITEWGGIINNINKAAMMLHRGGGGSQPKADREAREVWGNWTEQNTSEEQHGEIRKLQSFTLKPQERSPAGHQPIKRWLDTGCLKCTCCCINAEQVASGGSWAAVALTGWTQAWLVEFIWGKFWGFSPPLFHLHSCTHFFRSLSCVF